MRGLLGVEDPVPVVGVQQAGPEPGVVDELLRAVAEDRLDLRAGVEPGAVGAGARGVDRGRQLLGELRRDRGGARGLVGPGRRALRTVEGQHDGGGHGVLRSLGRPDVAWWGPRRVRPSPQRARSREAFRRRDQARGRSAVTRRIGRISPRPGSAERGGEGRGPGLPDLGEGQGELALRRRAPPPGRCPR